MTPEKYIDQVFEQQELAGLERLDAFQKQVYLLSKAEITCDIDGVENIVDHWSKEQQLECVLAYRNIGATVIADALQQLVQQKTAWPSERHYKVTDLIRNRVGYDSESLERWVSQHLTGLSKGRSLC